MGLLPAGVKRWVRSFHARVMLYSMFVDHFCVCTCFMKTMVIQYLRSGLGAVNKKAYKLSDFLVVRYSLGFAFGMALRFEDVFISEFLMILCKLVTC